MTALDQFIRAQISRQRVALGSLEEGEDKELGVLLQIPFYTAKPPPPIYRSRNKVTSDDFGCNILPKRLKLPVATSM